MEKTKNNTKIEENKESKDSKVSKEVKECLSLDEILKGGLN